MSLTETGPTQRQIDLLAAEDWRFHAVGPGGTGLAMIATTERMTKLSKRSVSFGLPSAPALYLSLAREAHKKRANIQIDDEFVDHGPVQGVYPERHQRIFDFFESFAAEVVFSFTAIEAFANEAIPTNFTYQTKNSRKECVVLSADQIERQISLDDKLKRVLPLAHGVASPAGTKAWQGFKELKSVRDRLVHLKQVDRKSSGPEHQTIWGLMLSEKRIDFPAIAHNVIGSFPSLVKDRRWFNSFY